MRLVLAEGESTLEMAGPIRDRRFPEPSRPSIYNIRKSDSMKTTIELTPRVSGLVIGMVVVGGYCVTPIPGNASFEAFIVGLIGTSSDCGKSGKARTWLPWKNVSKDTNVER